MSMDVLAGIMILYMVIMHVMQWAELQDTALFYNLSVVFGCFMPWFFFKGGMFFKHNSNTKLLIGGGKAYAALCHLEYSGIYRSTFV